MGGQRMFQKGASKKMGKFAYFKNWGTDIQLGTLHANTCTKL